MVIFLQRMVFVFVYIWSNDCDELLLILLSVSV